MCTHGRIPDAKVGPKQQPHVGGQAPPYTTVPWMVFNTVTRQRGQNSVHIKTSIHVDPSRNVAGGASSQG